MNRENPECPLCNQELNHEDVFGRILRHQDGKIIGDIYRCENEECEGQGNHYYTYREGDYNLHEGYPC